MILDGFFTELWDAYTKITPSAEKIRRIFQTNGETVENDHVAFRTIDSGALSIANIQPFLFDLGYKVFDSYVFKEKKLFANAYIHEEFPELPKIFLSGLQPNYFSDKVQKILDSLVGQAFDSEFSGGAFFHSGRLWQEIDIGEYQTLAKESEYAAWVAAHGFVPNHFTVSVNHLVKTRTVESVLDLVESNGFRINEMGSRVKGSRDLCLEQGSTMSDFVKTKFWDGTLEVPSCYYEFALRHPTINGELYQGFVEKSADKIFESTNR